MNPLTLSQVAAFAGGAVVGGGALAVTRVVTDTRSVSAGDLFVALRGEKFDGHDFVGEALRRGAVGAIVKKDFAMSPSAGFGLVMVDDTLAALQLLAKNYRRALNVSVVAITGSNGKTSTKEFVAAVLAAKFRVHKTTGNLNNHIGVPLTVMGIDDSHEYAVVEMGMNHPGELAPLVDIAKPDIGIITNIGWAHIAAFADRDEIALEKARVIACLPADGLAILPDNEWLPMLRLLTKARVVTVSGAAALPVTGSHMARNAALAAALGGELGISPAQITASLSAVKLPGNRLSVKKFRGGWLVNDTYNASPDSMLAAFDTVQNLGGGGRKVALLGSMGELGAESQRLHREVGAAAARAGFDVLFALGEHAADLVAGAQQFEILRRDAETQSLLNQKNLRVSASPREYQTFPDHASLSAAYEKIARADDKILVKGSRSQRMELIVSELEKQEASCCIS